MSSDVGHFLADGGAVVGGAAALFGTVGFVVATVVHEFRPQTDPETWTRRAAVYGGIVGLAVFLVGA
jgi:hypothetical protein